ncbi:MAG: HNH endonuclease signature motif containing protein [Nitrososphaeraceae archaeon]
MAKNASLFSLGNFDLHGPTTCIILVLISTILLPVYAQSEGLEVIVSNERDRGEVCVFSESETLPCKYIDFGDDEEFQFAPNSVQVDEEFQVCLDDELCITRNNSPENKPEIVILSEVVEEEAQSSGADLEAQSSGANQPQEGITDSGNASGLVISILLIAAAAAIGMGIKRRSRKKKQEERHGFPDIVKERVLKKQNHRCAHCRHLLNVVDWDHKNGKRYDNSESNCQALCPNCHAVKTRNRR